MQFGQRTSEKNLQKLGTESALEEAGLKFGQNTVMVYFYFIFI